MIPYTTPDIATTSLREETQCTCTIVHGVHIEGIYLHRNGHQYKVLAVACNVDDLTWHVIYEALYKNDVSQIWCRNLEDFLAVITLENGINQPRFMHVDLP